eukprot:gene9329-biopygen11195
MCTSFVANTEQPPQQQGDKPNSTGLSMEYLYCFWNNGHNYAVQQSAASTCHPLRFCRALARAYINTLAFPPGLYLPATETRPWQVPGDSRPKRVAQSVNRTIKWLDECLERNQVQQQQQQQQAEQQSAAQPSAAESDCGSNARQQLFAPVVGAGLVPERERSAKAAAERTVAGFALCGFGMGESTSARPALLEAALRHLPADKPRLVSGLLADDTDVCKWRHHMARPASPVEVLDAVAQGVDLFDCSYPTHATSNGYALSFPLRQQEADKPGAAAAAGAAALAVEVDAGADDTKLNLWSLQHRSHRGPLVAGCSCFTCQNHSRGYIHHLLHTHEMLASVLLEMHNTHWWLGFFAAIQEAIRAGQLQQYISWFKQRKQVLQALQTDA